MTSIHFQSKPFNIAVIQVYAPTTNAEEVKVDQFYEEQQHLLELTPKMYVLFITGDRNVNISSHEIPGITASLALNYKMKQGKV